jgi:hypothetical protein
MNFVMGVTVGLEFSGISSVDIPEISNPTTTFVATFFYRYIRDLQPHSNTHGLVYL